MMCPECKNRLSVTARFCSYCGLKVYSEVPHYELPTNSFPILDTHCLLIIDVQNGFVDDTTRHIPALIEKAQYDYDHIVACKFINAENSPIRKYFPEWNRCMPGSDDTSFAFALRPDALVLEKSGYSCVDKDFIAWCALKKITTVHICGMDTDVCVTKCAVDIFENGLRPVVLKDLCASTGGYNAHYDAFKALVRFIGGAQIC